MESILVYKNDIDENVTNNDSYNISTHGIDNLITNYYDYFDVNSDGSASLKQNLFTIKIGNDIEFDSSKFTQPKTYFEKGNGEAYAFKLKLSGKGEEQNPFAEANNEFDATFSLQRINTSKDQLMYKMKITLKVFCDSNGSLPSIKIKQGNTTSPSNITSSGIVVDYEYSSTNFTSDTIYKPSGDSEKFATKSDNRGNVGKDKIRDSYFRNSGEIEGFFGNPYVNKENFVYPNFNVKVSLVYEQALKTMNSSMYINTNKSSDIDIKSYKTGSGWYELLLTKPGNMTIYENNGIEAIGKLFTDNIITKDVSQYENSSSKDIQNSLAAGLILDHYYIYVVQDAYNIMSMLKWIHDSNTITNTTHKSLALDIYEYILTFDPVNFIGKDGSGAPEYILGDKADEPDPNAKDKESQEKAYFTYKEAHDLLSQYENSLRNAGYNFKLLPQPGTVNNHYMYLRKVDVLTAAFNGNDYRFLNLNFSQTDFVIVSSEVKELYQKQILDEGGKDPIWDMHWNANQAYSYCDTAISEIDFTKDNGVFSTQISGSEINGMLAGEAQANSNVRDQSAENKRSQYWCVGGSYTGTFQTLIRSAIAIPKDKFTSTTTNYTSIQTKFYLHDYAPETAFSDSPKTYDRVKTADFGYDPGIWKGIVKTVVSYATGPLGNAIWNLAEGKSVDQILAEALNTLTSSGIIGAVKGVVSIFNEDVKNTYKAIYNNCN